MHVGWHLQNLVTQLILGVGKVLFVHGMEQMYSDGNVSSSYKIAHTAHLVMLSYARPVPLVDVQWILCFLCSCIESYT